jgi:hypothetical protein
MVITMRVDGGRALAAGLAAAPRSVGAAATAAMQRSVLLVEADARAHVAHDTRALMNSISSRVEGRGTHLVGLVGPSLRYGQYVETGTRPHWPPRAPLEGWARRHGIPVFLVQRAIARRGTRARPFLAPALTRNVARIVRLFADVGLTVTTSIARATNGAAAHE